MPRQRKGKAAPAVPETLPPRRPDRPTEAPLIEIPEDEQWRLINQTGILKTAPLHEVPAPDAFRLPVVEERLSLSDEIFNSILLIIPFSSLLLLMEILIRHQYGKTASLEVILDRMGPGVPIMSLFIFYTTRYKHDKRMQFFLFVLGTVTGCRMIYQYNNASWLVNMKQCPPLATIWIYTIVQLDLGPAIVSLLVVGVFVWWKELKLGR